ncbi:extracellular solute-binding protein [Alicyclobacillus ferrooxydans]|uniref:ABC transporter substrate-binding protein n=1 Tax=Alicyclobacillus ferrooxydans TaxID=471514 RepID=A0A0P9D376_9BACL|nr:extracellular solute-binding protein [Alicyclobacillus ferrooxydans]KPV43961.1 hypothetical protein AN477_09590 [Alicyclobacillus ferrooxydans]
MRIGRKAFYLGLSAATLAAITGCGTSSGNGNASGSQGGTNGSGAIVINFWSSGPAGKGFQSVISNFNKKYKGKYDVVFKAIPYANETELVNSALSAHKQPDILEESLTPSAPYAYEGIEEPIEPLLKSVGINPSKDFPASMWNGTTVNGVHYVAPLDALPTLLYYNKALFKQAGLNPNDPPTTEAQFVSDAEKLTNQSKKQWGFVEQPEFNTWTFPSLLSQFGGQEANASTRKIEFNSPAGLNALNFLYNTIFKWHVSPEGASPNEYSTLFVKGQNAMSMSGSFNVEAFKSALGNNLGIALLPKVGSQNADFLGQNYWWVFKSPSLNAQKKQGIALFMKYMYDNSMTLATEDGLFPTWEPAMKNPQFKNEYSMNVQEEAVKYGVLNPLIPNWGTTSTQNLYQTMDESLLGKLAPQAALSQAASSMQQEVNQLVK